MSSPSPVGFLTQSKGKHLGFRRIGSIKMELRCGCEWLFLYVGTLVIWRLVQGLPLLSRLTPL